VYSLRGYLVLLRASIPVKDRSSNYRECVVDKLSSRSISFRINICRTVASLGILMRCPYGILFTLMNVPARFWKSEVNDRFE